MNTLTKAAQDVLAERQRQIEKEGWTPEHDDEHGDNSMAIAAACYALADYQRPLNVQTVSIEKLWQWTGWASHWFKPKDKRRNLIRAGALILAEIERLDRSEAARWKPCSRCTTPDYCTNRLRGCDIAESREAGIAPLAATSGGVREDGK